MTYPNSNQSRSAFTLVELVIVVMILGILAGVAVPKLIGATRLAAENAFISQLLIYIDAVERCKIESNEYPFDASTGEMPVELEPYLRGNAWSKPTPLGGKWDIETDSYGIRAGVGVVKFAPTDSYKQALTRIDARIDDGDVETGSVRFISYQRYCYVIE